MWIWLFVFILCVLDFEAKMPFLPLGQFIFILNLIIICILVYVRCCSLIMTLPIIILWICYLLKESYLCFRWQNMTMIHNLMTKLWYIPLAVLYVLHERELVYEIRTACCVILVFYMNLYRFTFAFEKFFLFFASFCDWIRLLLFWCI